MVGPFPLWGRWRASVSLILEPRDLWVGVYWNTRAGFTEVYTCAIPCLPIRVAIWPDDRTGDGRIWADIQAAMAAHEAGGKWAR